LRTEGTPVSVAHYICDGAQDLVSLVANSPQVPRHKIDGEWPSFQDDALWRFFLSADSPLDQACFHVHPLCLAFILQLARFLLCIRTSHRMWFNALAKPSSCLPRHAGAGRMTILWGFEEKHIRNLVSAYGTHVHGIKFSRS